MVSRRGWYLGILAVKSDFGLRSGVDLGYQFLNLFPLWRWERVVVCGCLLSRFGGLVSCFRYLLAECDGVETRLVLGYTGSEVGFWVAEWSRSRLSISKSVSSVAVGACGRVWVRPPTFSGSVGLQRFSGDELVVVLAAV
ncbi:hypothetical protein DY000_02049553 [Brassica cretica]|uniref:Uncharacterized protein n=1 Tax=Brassica cretica TaxID=69181 RepID=A0ABQ7F0H1_BRACR|nr:hypothetical protein DY000_02049553 [Brassica cretica]